MNLENEFPRLSESSYRITSPISCSYNCIAWAAAEEDVWLWPDFMFQYYWPPGVPREETVEAFVQAFRSRGYVNCESGDLDVGFEKVAIFARPEGTPTHAARQLPDGTWTSKLGPDVDISHDVLTSVSGLHYGEPAAFLRRPLPSKPDLL